MAQLEFFYDYVSIYSYLANVRVRDFDNVRYRPFFLGGVMEATGNRPPATVKAKGPYLMNDAQRWAKRYGVPLKMNSVFPQNTLHALRLALVAQQQGFFDDVHQRIFDAMWVNDQHLGDDAVIRSIVEQAGQSVDDVMSRIADDSVKSELKANTQEAVERGAFGAPTFFVGDQMFFGNDRFDFIEDALAGRG